MVRYRFAAALSLFVFLPVTIVTAHDSCALECQKTKQKIAKIESKMRHGYSVSAGEKMKEDLRRLKRLRSKVCR